MSYKLISPGDTLSTLNATSRSRARDDMASGKLFDLLVVGGGVTGTGVALDAASRGLSVALIEATDFASGTSRWSSKMVHGGLRYLAKGDVGVAWESAVERARISQRIAPHLVHPFIQIIPFEPKTSAKTRAITRAGLIAGDSLRRLSGVPSSYLPAPRRIGPSIAYRLAPGLPAGVDSAMVGWDCRLEDDARFVTTIARTAAAYGATLCTHASAIEIDATGARVRDELDGGEFQVDARHVINATGVWAGSLDPNVDITLSRGTHVVVRSTSLGNPSASITVPVPDHFGRFVFAIPQFNGLTYIGLTDEPAPGAIPDVPIAPEADIEWILNVINLGLAKPLTREDVVGTYAGLRPLVTGDSVDGGSTADISRKHLVTGKAGELITVTGGKLTTYRQMAQDAVDRITDAPCVTADLPLVGFGTYPESARVPRRLTRRFGSEAGLVASLADNDSSLLEPLGGPGPVRALRVEVLWAMAAEGALTYEDVADRRLRVSLVPADEALVRDEINDLMVKLTDARPL